MKNCYRLVLSSFKTLKVLVIGEGILDLYIKGSANRLCKEAPVPVVETTEVIRVAGGAANTAVNASALGAQTYFLSVVGKDESGEILLSKLSEKKVDISYTISDPSRKTIVKQRMVSNEQLLARFDDGTTEDIKDKIERQFLKNLKRLFVVSDVIVISDYGYGILTPKVIETLTRLKFKYPEKILTVDAKHANHYRNVPITVLKQNFSEALSFTQDTFLLRNRLEQARIMGKQMLDQIRAQIISITLDSDGAYVFERGGTIYRTYSQPVIDSKTIGAGDTYTAAFSLALAVCHNINQVADIASAAASVVVSKMGTAVCKQDELLNVLEGNKKYVTGTLQIVSLIQRYKEMNKRIVFTSGCFDILHSGHVKCLENARQFGDVLIVGVNSDASVRRLKGALRPINTLKDRVEVLAGLSSIDHIISFKGNTPINLIKLIKPDVYVKGGDYSPDRLPEAAIVQRLGGKVEIVPYINKHSTTKIINRIRDQFYTQAISDRKRYGVTQL